MNIYILFGTESGTAEMLADEVADAIADSGVVTTSDMSDVDPADLSPDDFLLVLCSTHGEGELPSSAVPFVSLLNHGQPDLRGIRYAMFGLGDSSYDNYSRGSEIVNERLRACGAERVGAYGRYDASGHDDPMQIAREWALEAVTEVARFP